MDIPVTFDYLSIHETRTYKVVCRIEFKGVSVTDYIHRINYFNLNGTLTGFVCNLISYPWRTRHDSIVCLLVHFNHVHAVSVAFNLGNCRGISKGTLDKCTAKLRLNQVRYRLVYFDWAVGSFTTRLERLTLPFEGIRIILIILHECIVSICNGYIIVFLVVHQGTYTLGEKVFLNHECMFDSEISTLDFGYGYIRFHLVIPVEIYNIANSITNITLED